MQTWALLEHFKKAAGLTTQIVPPPPQVRLQKRESYEDICN